MSFHILPTSKIQRPMLHVVLNSDILGHFHIFCSCWINQANGLLFRLHLNGNLNILKGQPVLTIQERKEEKKRRETRMRWDIHPVIGNRQQWLRILMKILKINFKCFLHGKSKVGHFIHHYWPDSFIPCLSFWLCAFFSFPSCQVVFFLTEEKKKKLTECGSSQKFLCRRSLTGCGFVS